MSKLRLLALVGLLATALTPLYGCGSECAPGTTEKDGQCVVSSKGCADGTVLMDGECVLDTSGCSDRTVFDNGVCVPAEGVCEEGTSFDQDTKTCIPNTDIVCGDGTEPGTDGYCVPGADACSDKTQLDDNGRCVVAAAACGAGTELDPNTGECELAEAGCGTGLAFDGDTGVCVPTAEICDSGTAFDSDSGLCLPDACQEGDVLVNGICMSPAEELALDADTTGFEQNDPALGGSPELITMPAVDADPFVFVGNIDAPTDVDGDGSLDQDVDVYEFDAFEGDWFEIMVQSTGLEAPAFKVEGPNDYVRWSAVGVSGDAARSIIIPEDGTYTITVLPSIVLQSEGEVSLVGGDDWGFVGSFKAISAPAGTDYDLSTGPAQISGEFPTLSDNVLNLIGLQMGDIVRVSIEPTGNSANGQLQVWDATGILSHTESTNGGVSYEMVALGNSATLVLDWIQLNGPNADYDVTASVAGAESSVVIPAGGSESISVSANQWDQIFASHTNLASEDLKVEVTNSFGDSLNSEAALAPDTVLKTFVDTADTYTVTFTNETASNVDATLTVKTIPGDLGLIPDGATVASYPMPLDEGEETYLAFSVNPGQLIQITHDNDEGTDLEFELMDTNQTSLVSETYFYPISYLGDQMYYASETGGTFLLRIESRTDSWSDNAVTNETVYVTSMAPNDLGSVDAGTTATQSHPNVLPDGASDIYKFTLASDTNTEIAVTTPGGEDVDIFLYDSSFSQIDSGTSISNPEVITDAYGAGTYYLRVYAYAELPSYELNITAMGNPPSAPDFSSTPAIAIPDDLDAGTDVTLTASNCTTISDVQVFVEWSHEDTGDVELALTSPSGTTVQLRDSFGGGTTGQMTTVSGWYPNTFVPEESLSAFVGETGTGTWTLNVADTYSGDLGTLDEWGLTLTCQ